MIDPLYLNIGSLVFGLISWVLPIISLIHYKKHSLKKYVVYATCSLSTCAISLCMQLFYTGHLIQINDWTALLDTYEVVSFVSLTLLVVTILINTITLILYLKKR